MGRHRAPRLWPAVLAVTVIVIVTVALLCLAVPALPLPVIFRPDVRAPVPVVGPSHIPIAR